MMRFVIFILLTFYPLISVYAQDASRIPVFLNNLQTATTDSARVEAYRDLCFNYSIANTDSGIYYGKKGLEIAQRIKFLKGIGDSYNSLGWCYSRKGDYTKAKKHLTLALQYFEQTNDKCNVAVVLSNIGSTYFNQSLYADALEYYLKSVDLSNACTDAIRKPAGLYSIGIVYNSQGEYNKAIPYFREAAALNEQINDSNKLADCINGIGNAYLGLEMYDSAFHYLNQSSAMYQKLSNISGTAYAAESIGSIYLKQGNFDMALKQFEFARENFEKSGSQNDLCYELTLIGDAYRKYGKINSAIIYMKMALQIADSNRFQTLQLQTLNSLSELYAMKHDYQNAYLTFKQAAEIKDTINETKQQARLDEIKTKFETEQKDKMIEILNRDKAIEKSNAEWQRQLKNIFIVGAVMLFLILLNLYNRFSLKKRAAQQLEQKNIIIAQEKERAERSEKFKQQFLANMSHEIRTPLNAIFGMTELLQETKQDEQSSKYLQVIKQSSESLLVIINDILDLSKIEAGKMEIEKTPFRFRETINHVYQTFSHKAASKELDLKFSVGENVPELIIADPFRITQVLINLVGNAIKFTERGFVIVSINQVRASQKHGLNYCDLLFEVSDSGIGLPAGQQEKIFESFQQTYAGNSRKYGGTGLGLTISQSLVQLMGGNIEVSSVENQGTIFSFTIEVEVADALAETNKSEQVPIQLIIDKDAFSVLLIEDNEFNQILVKDALSKKMRDIKLQIVGNGRDAIEILKNQKFNLILMDISMPEMDGYEITQIIRNELKESVGEIPIVALTANVSQHEAEKCIAAGMNDYLSKPFKISELTDVINRFKGDVDEQKIDSRIKVAPIASSVDLAYLRDFTDGDIQEMLRYVDMYLQRIPEVFNEIEISLKGDEEKHVIVLLHSIKPLIASVGLNDCVQKISELEKQRETIKKNKLMPVVLLIRRQCMTMVDSLKLWKVNNSAG
ncbi:MAG: tetratricopeptide repeat protein [Bacteroidota bacterium]